MQTFLPYYSFVQSAKCLDYRRLGKQRLEAMQLVNSTLKLERGEPVKGWANHPARIMWIGCLDALKLYHNVCVAEWVLRGYKNTMKFYDLPDKIEMPHWLGDPKFHDSHKSNLLKKDFAFYSQYNWNVGPDLDYYWPVGQQTNVDNMA